jgi:hypothetical protein
MPHIYLMDVLYVSQVLIHRVYMCANTHSREGNPTRSGGWFLASIEHLHSKAALFGGGGAGLWNIALHVVLSNE